MEIKYFPTKFRIPSQESGFSCCRCCRCRRYRRCRRCHRRRHRCRRRRVVSSVIGSQTCFELGSNFQKCQNQFEAQSLLVEDSSVSSATLLS